MLGVSKVLDGPSLVFSFLSLPNILIVLDLLGSSSINLVDGLGLEALEMVRDISKPAKLRGGGHMVLSHEVVHLVRAKSL